MTKRDPLLNKEVAVALVAILAFYPLTLILPLDSLIILLNGVFFGCMAGVVIAFWQLFWRAVIGEDPYDRVRQMTLSWVIQWIVIVGGVGGSFYIRAADLQTTSLISTAIFRYLACIAAVLQVTAPDFGLGIFHGRDRKTLWTSMVVGLVIATIAVWLQAEQMLEPLVKSAFGIVAQLDMQS